MQPTVAGHIYEDLGQTFFGQKQRFQELIAALLMKILKYFQIFKLIMSILIDN